MKISVKVKPNSKKEGVEIEKDGTYIVRVNMPPIEGKANKRVQKLLAKFLAVPKTSVQLASGARSKIKTFKIG